MDFVLALFVYPALILALAVGGGLLIDRAAGGRLPGVLIPPLGLAVLVTTAELCAYPSLTSPLTPVALVLVGVAGYAVGLGRLRALRPDPWPLAAAVVVYFTAIAPVLLAGRVTVAGYLLDTTVAFHLAGSDYLIEHARDFARLPDSAMRRTLNSYFGTQYPSGGHTLLGGSGRLVGVDRIWLYQPFLSLLLAFCVPTLYHLARSATLSRVVSAAGAAAAAMPALVYAYAQMGAIKELTALPFALLLGSTLVLLPRLLERGPLAALVPATVAAAGIGAIGFAFVPWIGATAVAGLVLILLGDRRDLRSPRLLLVWSAVLAVGVVLLALPAFGTFTQSTELAGSFNTGITDPGNLLRPLLDEQLFGIWLGGSHRVDPPTGRLGETYLLIGVAALSALLGAAFLMRRRAWAVGAFVVVMGVVWVVLTRRGAAWTDAKLLVITSPIVILLAAAGVESLRQAGRRVEAVVIGAAIAFGILASNAFTYHETNLQPTDRYEELLEIGERYAGLAPTLTPEFDEFYFYALPDMATDSPGNASRTEKIARLVDGSFTGYGHSYDLDQLPLGSVQQYEAVVARRRPDASRPPAGFELAYQGDYYDVWRRTDAKAALAHVPLGGGLQSSGHVPCRRARRLGRQAESAGAELAYVARPGLLSVDGARLQRSARPPGWGNTTDGIGFSTPGTMDLTLRVPAGGRWRIWLKGDFGREIGVSVDGERLGGVSYQSSNEGNYGEPIEVDLTAGRHRFTIERGGGTLAPGNGAPTRLLAVVLEPVTGVPEVHTLPPARWRELCGRRVDWIEVVRPS